jgi:16S rRNA A1518/A1519 N6-dimethyltransferase RsmA/KsgA/DIM1 with predicted DNA glycosylase/AP lyase activity
MLRFDFFLFKKLSRMSAGVALKKKFSQNFTIKSLGSFEAQILPNDFVIEFGSGTGRLTRQILKRNPQKVFGLEIDSRFSEDLSQIGQKYANFEYILGDCNQTQGLVVEKIKSLELKTSPTIHITGNLPFNIAGELLANWNKEALLKKGKSSCT